MVNKRFSSIDLENRVSLRETSNFVGSGAYSTVYEGTLDHAKVAVKIVRCNDKNAIKVSLLVIRVSCLITMLLESTQ